MSTFRTKKESFAKSPEATLEDEEFNFVTKNLNKPKHKDYKTDCIQRRVCSRIEFLKLKSDFKINDVEFKQKMNKIFKFKYNKNASDVVKLPGSEINKHSQESNKFIPFIGNASLIRKSNTNLPELNLNPQPISKKSVILDPSIFLKDSELKEKFGNSLNFIVKNKHTRKKNNDLEEDEFVKTNTQSSQKNNETEIKKLDNKAKQTLRYSMIYQTFDFMKSGNKKKIIPFSSNYINTSSSYGSESQQITSQSRRKRFFNFKNMDVLQKQLTEFKKMSKIGQEEILLRELELDPPRIIATKNAKPQKKINFVFFNKAKAIHMNFKETSVIWPKIKPDILNNAIDLEYIFKNIINK